MKVERGVEMETYSPADVCEKLNIQPSTLRKYSSLLEKEQIIFERTKKNSRLYTATQVMAIEHIIATMQSGNISLENAITEASLILKGETTIAGETVATIATDERYSDNIAIAMMEEIKSLKEQLAEQETRQKERDSLFLEVLEKMQQQINQMEENQKNQLDIPQSAELLDTEELQPQEEKKKDTRGLWARIWNK